MRQQRPSPQAARNLRYGCAHDRQLRFCLEAYHFAGMPDPATLPEAYQGVLWRRTLAYFIDLGCIGVVVVLFWIVFAGLWVVSFGLLGPCC